MKYYLIKNGKRTESFKTWEDAYKACSLVYDDAPEGVYYGIETVVGSEND